MKMESTAGQATLRRLACAVLALALVLGLLPLAHAQAEHGLVTGDQVLFRKAITQDDYWARLDKDWVAKVLETTTQGGYTWYKIETGTPRNPDRRYTGYIRGDFFRLMTLEEEASWLANPIQPYITGAPITPVPTPNDDLPAITQPPVNPPVLDPSSTGSLRITKVSTNLRKTPGGLSIFKYDIGDVLNYYGAPTYYAGYHWMLIKDERRGLEGYIRSDCYDLVSTNGQPIITPGPVATPVPTQASSSATVRITLGGTNLRRTAGGSVIGVLGRGRILPYFGQPTFYGGYYWVYVYDSELQEYGYVRSDCYEILGGQPEPTASPSPDPSLPSLGTLTLIKGGVNLRDQPAGRTQGQLDKGLVMPYFSYVQLGGYTWYRVQSPLGAGYVRSDCVSLDQGSITVPTPLPDPGSPDPGLMGYVVVYKSGVNYRQSPSTKAAVLTVINRGLVLPLTGPVTTAEGYNWYRTSLNGQTGYLRGDVARQLSPQEVYDWINHQKQPDLSAPSPNVPVIAGYVLTVMDQVYVRATASRDARALGMIQNQGTVYPLLSTVNAGGSLWYRISYNNQDGFVLGSLARLLSAQEYQDYINSLPTPSPSPGPTAAPPPEMMSSTALTRVDKVLMRSGGGPQYRSLTTIYRSGSVVTLQGATNQVDNYTWYQVRYSGISGWIRGDLLRILTKVEEEQLLGTGTPTQPDQPGTASYRILRLGDSGEDVTRLQTELSRLGYLAAGFITGVYNDATVLAVRSYQRAHGLAQDGVAGPITQHKLYGTVPGSTQNPDGSSTVNPTIYPVEKVDWVNGDINSFWGRGQTAILTDVKTGISLRIKRWAGARHVDGEPLTAEDTAALCRIYGVKSAQEILDKNLYQRRPLWITIKGRSFAASLYGVPHNYPEGDTIPNNNFNGQLCIHFLNSRTHSSGSIDKGHMDAIDYAYNAARERK